MQGHETKRGIVNGVYDEFLRCFAEVSDVKLRSVEGREEATKGAGRPPLASSKGTWGLGAGAGGAGEWGGCSGGPPDMRSRRQGSAASAALPDRRDQTTQAGVMLLV